MEFIPEVGEVREGHDQLLYFVSGTGVDRTGDVETDIAVGDIGIVPSGDFHNIGVRMLKLFTTYRTPEYGSGSEHTTKAEADADE